MAIPGLSVVLTVLCVPAIVSSQSDLSPQPASTAVSPPVDRFVGNWNYNEDESVNAATGRQERSPRSAAQRTVIGRGGEGAGGGAGRATPPMPSADSARSSMGPRIAPGLNGQLGPTVAMIQENRSLTRDLLEVPESLTISLTSGQITFVDDLLRARVYPTSGEKLRYQLGAARFNAALEWPGLSS